MANNIINTFTAFLSQKNFLLVNFIISHVALPQNFKTTSYESFHHLNVSMFVLLCVLFQKFLIIIYYNFIVLILCSYWREKIGKLQIKLDSGKFSVFFAIFFKFINLVVKLIHIDQRFLGKWGFVIFLQIFLKLC